MVCKWYVSMKGWCGCTFTNMNVLYDRRLKSGVKNKNTNTNTNTNAMYREDVKVRGVKYRYKYQCVL